MATIISPNMSLPIPVVGVEPGPDYATDINNSLSILDAHDHTLGNGVQITPAAININAPLSMNNFTLTGIAALTLTAQVSTPSNGSIYESGVDLYYVDGVGNNIRITQSGSVAGSTGTITGLPSGTASAAFAIDTFTFQRATLTAANIDGASFILRNATASSFGLTLAPPNAMAANYTITLPNLPGSTSAVNMAPTGTLSTISYDGIGQGMTSLGANAIANTRTRAVSSTVGLGGVAISATINQNITSTLFVSVPSSAITITTNGRPVMLQCIPAPGVNATTLFNLASAPAFGQLQLQITRDMSTNVVAWTTLLIDSAGIGSFPPSAVSFVDAVAAGTYTYTIYATVGSGNSWDIINVSLCAYEL